MILLGVEPSLLNFTEATSLGTRLYPYVVCKNRAEKAPYDHRSRWWLSNYPTLTGSPLCLAFCPQNRKRKLFEKVQRVVPGTIAMTVPRNHPLGPIILPEK